MSGHGQRRRDLQRIERRLYPPRHRQWRVTDSGGLFSETATDAANNQATRSFTVTAPYNFSGFFPPVDNPLVVNVVNAGRAIPVKFSLGGNKGLNIFAPGYPVSQQIALR